MAVNGISGDIVPKKKQSLEELRGQYAAAGKDIAVIDLNGDGKYNYGKKEGDTIKIFDWDAKEATGYHLVKYGEESVCGTAKAGQVEKSTTGLGISLHKTFTDKTISDIRKMYPNAQLVDPKGGDKFTKGTTLMLTDVNGKRHNIYFKNNTDSEKQIWKMLSGQHKEKVQYQESERLGNTLYWYDVPEKK